MSASRVSRARLAVVGLERQQRRELTVRAEQRLRLGNEHFVFCPVPLQNRLGGGGPCSVALHKREPPNATATTTRTASDPTPARASRRARRCCRMSSPSSSSLATPCIGAARSATAERNRVLRRSRSVSDRAQRTSKWRGSSRSAPRNASGTAEDSGGEIAASRHPTPTSRR